MRFIETCAISNIYALLDAVKKLWYHHSQISRAKYRLLLFISSFETAKKLWYSFGICNSGKVVLSSYVNPQEIVNFSSESLSITNFTQPCPILPIPQVFLRDFSSIHFTKYCLTIICQIWYKNTDNTQIHHLPTQNRGCHELYSMTPFLVLSGGVLFFGDSLNKPVNWFDYR